MNRAIQIAACAVGLSAIGALTSAWQAPRGPSSFTILDINVQSGGTWQLNRAIELRFNQAVFFGSVTPGSIAIKKIGGPTAVGEFFLKPGDPKTVVFQPRCPLDPGYLDAGLEFGGVRYVIEVTGTNNGATAPVSTPSGALLSNSLRKTFLTPTNAAPNFAFYDTRPNSGPQPVVRPAGTDAINATHIELGGDVTQRIYFERDPATGVVSLASDVPLNLLSNASTQVALVIELDQAINPGPSNVALSRVHWQYLDQGGVWRELSATIELVRNCAGRGATVRLEPIGALPPATDLRGVIEPTFQDIVGQTNPLALASFSPAHTQNAPSPLADEYLEEFASTDNEDATVVFAEPKALWAGDGALRSSSGFAGTGGANGDFDWVVPTGTTLVVDTSFSSILGYQILTDANGVFTGYVGPINSQNVIGGVIDVDDMWIQQGAVVRIQGPNPVVFAVSGRAQIDGRIDASGTSSNGVTTLNTTNIPEPGAAGHAGGGRGGTANPLTTQSSPQGGAGFGAFNAPGLGGQGGETGWSLTLDNNKRRGAGGGGGTFGANVPAPAGFQGAFDQRRIGLDGEKGFDNWLGDNGANHPGQPPQGGAVGASPFVDADPTNDFFGKALDAFSGQVTLGELIRPWAGAGGGGGGNAAQISSGTFPGPFNPQGDEKGAGGAGGGGSLRLIALGPVVFGSQGELRARGGFGGGGENTIFLNRVGGGSGGGSGGHVIVESATRIDLSALPMNALAIDARGGQGGAGSGDSGGAFQSTQGQKETTPLQDACPPGYPTSGNNGCRGQVDGAGGDGGPGLVQLHTPRGVVGTNGALADIVVASGATLASVCSPPAQFATGSAGGAHLLASAGSKSRARSEWVDVGLGGFDPNGPAGSFIPLMLTFDGLDPATGLVRTTGGIVDELAPITGPTAVQNAPALPNIPTACGYQVVFDAAPIAASGFAFLLQNDELLDRSVLVLSEIGNSSNRARFDVVEAQYDGSAGTLSVWTANPGPDLCSFLAPGGVAVELQPALFRVATNGIQDALLNGASVRIAFQATTADANGAPDPSQTTAFTSDAAVINAAAANANLRFLRFDVLFDLGQNSLLGASSPLELDFLRLPYRY